MSTEEPLVAGWENVQKKMKHEVGEEVFSNFLGTLLPSSKDEKGVVVLTSPCRHYPPFIKEHYGKTLRDCLQSVDPGVTGVRVVRRTLGEPRSFQVAPEPSPDPAILPTDAEGATPSDESAPEEFEAAWEGKYAAPIGPRRPRVSEIQEAVCQHYHLSFRTLCGTERAWSKVRPRQLGMYLGLLWAKRPQLEVGRRFGNKDHTTVLNAKKKTEQRLLREEKLSQDISAIAAKLPFLSIYADPA